MNSVLDKEIKTVIAKLYDIEMKNVPDDSYLQQEYHLSESFYDKMNRLVLKMNNTEKARKLARFLAMTAAVVLAVFCLTNPVKVARAYELVIQWFENYISFEYREQLEDVSTLEYEVGYVPEGYTLVESIHDQLGGVVIFIREDKVLSVEYGPSDGKIHLDNEGKTYQVLYEDTEIHYLKAQNPDENSSITWLGEEEQVVFTIAGPLEQEELLKIRRGIVEKSTVKPFTK